LLKHNAIAKWDLSKAGLQADKPDQSITKNRL